MITKCWACKCELNDRLDVRITTGGKTLCSWECVWTYRGKERCT